MSDFNKDNWETYKASIPTMPGIGIDKFGATLKLSNPVDTVTDKLQPICLDEAVENIYDKVSDE